jgi:hypothetical protein
LRLRAIPGVESVSAHSYARTIELHGVCGMVLVEQGNGHTLRASIPLYASSNTRLGALNVASRCWRELSPEELRLLYTVGDLLSIAIERARLFEQSAQLGASEERNRLARELHDTLAQGLAAIALQLESAEALLEAGTDPKRLRRALTQALGLTRANLEEVRRSVLDLRAAPLEGRTLAAALADRLEAGGGSSRPRRAPHHHRGRPSITATPRGRALSYGARSLNQCGPTRCGSARHHQPGQHAYPGPAGHRRRRTGIRFGCDSPAPLRVDRP